MTRTARRPARCPCLISLLSVIGISRQSLTTFWTLLSVQHSQM